MMKRRTIELRELARLGGGAAVVRRRGGGATVVAERRLEVAAEEVRGGEAARGEDEERRHLFGGSKFILGARRNQSILTDASADDPDLENGLESPQF